MKNTDAPRNKSNQTEGQAAGPQGEALDDFDPDGWMSERPDYWKNVPRPQPPTRAAWLLHRAREFAVWAHLADRKVAPKVTEEEWIALSETVLGPLPRPASPGPKTARPATPDARKSARKPAAYSPTSRPGA